MSRRERERLTVMAGVRRKELPLVQAGGLLGLSYRQTKRLWRRQPHRQWRQRKASFGHDWFEGRRAACVLRGMVDDATGRVWAQLFEQETTHASDDLFNCWVQEHGLPASLYVDRDSIHRCERKSPVAEQLAGAEPQTQFGPAMAHLGVNLILAYSPQPKGRGNGSTAPCKTAW